MPIPISGSIFFVMFTCNSHNENTYLQTQVLSFALNYVLNKQYLQSDCAISIGFKVVEFTWSVCCFQCHQIRWQILQNLPSLLVECIVLGTPVRGITVFITAQLSRVSSFQCWLIFMGGTRLMRKGFVGCVISAVLTDSGT